MPQPQQAQLTAHAHRCFPRFSRVLSCTQHGRRELHSAAAQSSNAHSFTERRSQASHAMAQTIATDHRRAKVPQPHGSRLTAHTLTTLLPTLQPRDQLQ